MASIRSRFIPLQVHFLVLGTTLSLLGCGRGLSSKAYYFVGGSVTGLNGTVTLTNNRTDTLSQSASGLFAFGTRLLVSSPYSVTVSTQPDLQYCGVSNGSGIVGEADVSNVAVQCLTSGVARWASTTTQAPNTSTFSRVATDPSGNVFVAGRIGNTGTYSFGNGVLVTGAYSGNNALLVKYSSSGVAQWAVTPTSAANASNFTGAATDSDGNVYAAGVLSNTGVYAFGNGVSVTSPYAGNNTLLVKYNSSGVVQWAKTAAAASDASTFTRVFTDSNGNVYVGGTTSNTTTLSLGSGITATGGSVGTNPLLVRYNSSGVPQWAVTSSSGSGGVLNFHLAGTDSSGNVYVAGTTGDNTPVILGNGVTVTSGYNGNSPFTAKYNSSGVAQWGKTVVTSTTFSQFFGATCDSEGNVYGVGFITNPGSSYDFGNGVTVSNPSNFHSVLLLKYSSTGVPQWVKTVTTTGTSDATSATTDSYGNVYVAGYADSANLGFGNGVTATNSYTGTKLFVVKYKPSGVPLWVSQVTSATNTSLANSVHTDSNGNLYVAGSLSDNSTYGFGNGVTATPAYSGGANALIVQYTQ